MRLVRASASRLSPAPQPEEGHPQQDHEGSSFDINDVLADGALRLSMNPNSPTSADRIRPAMVPAAKSAPPSATKECREAATRSATASPDIVCSRKSGLMVGMCS